MLRGLHGRAALTESIQILGRGIDLRFLARHLRFESLQSRWDIVPAGSGSRRNGSLSTGVGRIPACDPRAGGDVKRFKTWRSRKDTHLHLTS